MQKQPKMKDGKYTLQRGDKPRRWKVTDTDLNVSITFIQHDYKRTQIVSAPPMPSAELTEAITGIETWLTDNYYSLMLHADVESIDKLWANRITALREEQGITMYRLAQLTGISKVTISRIEKGYSCKASTLETILLALGHVLTIK